jgi:hypothetical protein
VFSTHPTPSTAEVKESTGILAVPLGLYGLFGVNLNIT